PGPPRRQPPRRNGALRPPAAQPRRRLSPGPRLRPRGVSTLSRRSTNECWEKSMAAEIDLVVGKPKRRRPSAHPYDAPAGGWGSAKSVARSLLRERVVASAPPALLRQNKLDGFACVSCA